MKQIAFIVLIFFLAGCADKGLEFNKTDIQWHDSLKASIASQSKKNAEAQYLSLITEHPRSKFIKADTYLFLDYLISENDVVSFVSFLDQYISQFAQEDEYEHLEYLRIKALRISFPHRFRQQASLLRGEDMCRKYISIYPNGVYTPLVIEFLDDFSIIEKMLNSNIASLYERIGKTRASRYYYALSEINKPIGVNNPFDVNPARYIFEGDGGYSWYSPLIPFGSSVVSHNKNQEPKNVE